MLELARARWKTLVNCRDKGILPWPVESIPVRKVRGSVLFYSDLHPGSGVSNAEPLAKILAMRDKDTFTVDGGDTTPDSHRKEVFRTLLYGFWDEQYFMEDSLLRRRGGNGVKIPGNHDHPLIGQTGPMIQAKGWPETLDGLPKRIKSRLISIPLAQVELVPGIILTVGEKRYYFDHGSTFDWFLEGLVGPTEVMLGRMGWKRGPSAKDVSHLGKFVGHRTGQFAAYARLADLLGVDAVIIGHLHCPGVYEGGKVIVGSCFTNGWAAYTVIEPDGTLIRYGHK